ncbi:MAG: class I SAM-dependent methyltransferase [Myxococcales bacterium]|nr:class I SAM-dependent methyltransferase [Myxococcales bacterium]
MSEMPNAKSSPEEIPRVHKRLDKLKPWQRALFVRFYAGRPDWADGIHRAAAFFLEHGRAGRILDLGCGVENRITNYLARAHRGIVGVDLDPRAAENPAIAEFHLFDGRELPFADGSFDTVFSNMVLEHVDDVDLHFREVFRVLRPGGRYLLNTPNVYHYAMLVSRFSPHWFHQAILGFVQAKPERDPYPTYYHCNTAREIRALARRTGFGVIAVLTTESEPSYLWFNPLLFVLGVAYERLVNATDQLAFLRSALHVGLEKPRH